MKRIALWFCGFWIGVSTFAQAKQVVSISTDRTTSLVFPFPVHHVDIGTKDILVQKIPQAENLLLVKAGVANFKATNLTVVTADGGLYCMDLKFEENPARSVHYLQSKERVFSISFAGEAMNLGTMKTYATGILDNSKHIRGIRNRKWDLLMKLNGIYVKDGVMFLQVLIRNLSPVNYDIDFVRFYIRDKRKLKRTAVQELELVPLCRAGDISKVDAFDRTVLVFAFDKFTIPDAKQLVIQFGEKNGGRHLRLKVSNSKILQARILPALN